MRLPNTMPPRPTAVFSAKSRAVAPLNATLKSGEDLRQHNTHEDRQAALELNTKIAGNHIAERHLDILV